MGGNAWSGTGPYHPDLAVAFRQAQDQALALARTRNGHRFGDRAAERLWHDPEWVEFVLMGGTGTVLDFPLLLDATDPHEGPFLRPLTDPEVRAWAPDGRPTVDHWRQACRSGSLDYPGRGQGNCTVLYDSDGTPVAVGYWGVTSD